MASRRAAGLEDCRDGGRQRKGRGKGGGVNEGEVGGGGAGRGRGEKGVKEGVGVQGGRREG